MQWPLAVIDSHKDKVLHFTFANWVLRIPAIKLNILNMVIVSKFRYYVPIGGEVTV